MTQAARVRAYIGIGSNLQQPAEQVRRAIGALHHLPHSQFIMASRLYASKPMGPADQPDYVNAVAAIETTLSPLELLDALQAIESEQGRVRDAQRWGPRVIDLDLLLYGEKTLSTERLVIPHPGLHQRSFVLYPLYDIAADVIIPGHGPLAQLVARIDADDLEPLTSA